MLVDDAVTQKPVHPELVDNSEKVIRRSGHRVGIQLVDVVRQKWGTPRSVIPLVSGGFNELCWCLAHLLRVDLRTSLRS